LASLALILGIHTIAPQQVSAQASDDDAYGSTAELGEYFDGRIWSVVGIEVNPSSGGSSTTIVVVVIVVIAIGAGAGIALTKRRPRN